MQILTIRETLIRFFRIKPLIFLPFAGIKKQNSIIKHI